MDQQNKLLDSFLDQQKKLMNQQKKADESVCRAKHGFVLSRNGENNGKKMKKSRKIRGMNGDEKNIPRNMIEAFKT